MIYFLKDVRGGPIKIGTTIRLAARLSQISKEISVPLDGLEVLAVMDGSLAEERALHERFAKQRVQGEWFLPSRDLLALIEDEGRPWSEADDAERKEATTAFDRTLLEKARWIAAYRGVTIAKYLSGISREAINSDLAALRREINTVDDDS